MKLTAIALVYILTVFATYLIASFAVSIIGDYNFRAVLTHQGQIMALIFIYWWCPAIFVAADMDEGA